MRTWRVVAVAVCLLAVAGPSLAADGGTGIEINIPNGGFEEWEGGKPVGFGSYSTPAGSKIEIETVFRSTDAHSGDYSALIKNMPMQVPGMPEGLKLPGMPEGLIMPGGLASCKRNCSLNTGRRSPPESMTFPIDRPADYFCGYYKADLLGGDKVLVSLGVRSGGELVGGTDSGDGQGAYITEPAREWTRFKFPIHRYPGRESAILNEGILQITIVPEVNRPSSTMPQAVGHLGSKILVDTLHLCGGGVDLAIFQPLFDDQPSGARSGYREIPPDKEDSVGAQTFLNLDNDDRDGAFDGQDTDGVEGGDDELVQLRLRLPLDAEGKVTLSQVGGRSTLEYWTSQVKSPDTKLGPLRIADFTRTTTHLEKIVFVEALSAPSAEQRDVKLELAYQPATPAGAAEQTDQVALTVLGIESITWEGRGNSENYDDRLLADPNYPPEAGGGAVRVFPGRQLNNAMILADPKNNVGVKVRLSVVPVEPVELHFQAFDVDDPTSRSAPLDSENSSQDNRECGLDFESGVNCSGYFVGFSRRVKTSKVFDDGVETLDFEVGMQPGDNYRIVGSGDRDFLENLGNDDERLASGGSIEDLMRIVDKQALRAGKTPENAEVRDPDKYVSKTLTVWRYVHLELDAMEPVKNNFVRGTIDAVRPAPGGGTLVTISENLASAHPTSNGPNGVANSYAGGTFTNRITGAELPVLGNSANPYDRPDTLTIQGEVSEEWLRQSFHLIDDDSRNGFPEGKAFDPPPLDRLETALKPAYIAIWRKESLPNRTPLAPYRINTDVEEWAFDELDNRDLKKLDFWVVYLLAAHQGETDEDGDGEANPIAAKANAGKTGALIFMEAAQEREDDNRGALGKRVIDAVPQAVGALFGAEPGDGGLMEGLGETFSDASLDKIRDARAPGVLPW